MVAIFSIPAFFLVLREVLEACLIIGIVLAYLNKTGATQYRKWVWAGGISGAAVAVVVGLGFGIYYWVEGEQAFTEEAEQIFEGVTFLVATVLLTGMIISMMGMGRSIEKEVEEKVSRIVDSDRSPRRRKFGLFAMVFVQVMREGIETVIFLIGTASADEHGGWRAIPLPGILAITIGITLSVLMFKGIVHLDLVRFFYFCAFFFVAFAAGLVSNAFHELQEVGWFGEWDEDDASNRDWYNVPMWSTEFCCSDEDNQFFAMLRALFGYQDKPTFIEWATYFGYWLVIVVAYVIMGWSRIRASRKSVALRTRSLTLLSLFLSFVMFIYTLLNRTWAGLTSTSIGLVLSVIAVISLFDITARLFKPLLSFRRAVTYSTGVGFSLLTIYMFVLHLVEMQCIGREDCSMGLYFFFGFIFNPGFLESGKLEDSFPPISALSFSIVITVFYYGLYSLHLILAALNIDEEGYFHREDMVPIKKAEEQTEQTEASDLTQLDISNI